MKLKELKNKLWFNIFIRVALIFTAFVIIIAVCNVSMLVEFFCFREKTKLKEQLAVVSTLDISDVSATSEKLSEISEKYNFDIEIYKKSGKILFTTHGGQMMDYFAIGDYRFNMSHEEMLPIKTEQLGDGIVFQTARRRFDKSEYLLCYKEISDGVYAEVRIQKELISSSADIANEFIIIISVICFAVSIIWVFAFAKKFSKPIIKMNDITRDMAELKFDRKLDISNTDEIGQLAVSINNMSDSLSAALSDLRKSNAKLKDEIELERQLDVMRRGFVANVSHELKTPISIISGYAEGLKLNINAEAKENYCNVIIDESARMNRLVLSILELSRYESGQMQVNKQNFNICATVDEMLKRIFSGKNVTAVNKIPADTVISSDPVQTEQVLKAYLENAVSHTPENGEVTVEAENRGGAVRISVTNTGSHVDEDIMSQIWQSFFRGDRSHKRESSRFGLGLSIVSATMKLHDHSCGVYNTNDGVCFWFEEDAAAE